MDRYRKEAELSQCRMLCYTQLCLSTHLQHSVQSTPIDRQLFESFVKLVRTFLHAGSFKKNQEIVDIHPCPVRVSWRQRNSHPSMQAADAGTHPVRGQ